jgi:prolipoprotein diacylglyceryltransferase
VTEHPDGGPTAADEPRQVSLRRAPRYRAFVVSGLLVGLLAAGVLYVLFPGGVGEFSARAVFGYVAAGLGLVGGVLGGLAAVLVERPHRR